MSNVIDFETHQINKTLKEVGIELDKHEALKKKSKKVIKTIKLLDTILDISESKGCICFLIDHNNKLNLACRGDVSNEEIISVGCHAIHTVMQELQNLKD